MVQLIALDSILVIPIRDVVPTRVTPWATLAGIAALALTAVASGLDPAGQQDLVRRWGFVPDDRAWHLTIVALLVPGDMVTTIANLGALWLFGSTLEDRLGPARFVVCAIAAGTIGYAVLPATRPGVLESFAGATPAIAGVTAAYFTLFPASRVLTLIPLPIVFDATEVPAFFYAGAWLILTLAAASGSVLDPGPAGGLVFVTVGAGAAVGLASALVLRRPERLRPDWWDGGTHR